MSYSKKEEKKSVTEELSEIAAFLKGLQKEDYKTAVDSYIQSFEDLVVTQLTESLFVNVITNPETKSVPEPNPLPLSVLIKSAFEKDSNDSKESNNDSKESSFATIYQSFKENIILKPIFDILDKIIEKVAPTVNQMKKESITDKAQLENEIRVAIQGLPEYKELREKINAMMGGKKRSMCRRKRFKRTSKLKRRKRVSHKGGNLVPSTGMKDWIRQLFDRKVKIVFK
jgi:hypothetical protein